MHGGHAWLVARDDLAARLDRAAAGMVTIVSAPAGSGKTTLLRAWAQRTDQADRVAYVPVRRDEPDAQVFWAALLNAVRESSGAAGDPEPLTAAPGFDVRASAGRLRAELARQHGRTIVVIDDLHELNSSESVAELGRLLATLPPNVHAVLATRRDLRLGLHQLRLAGELDEIRAADLRFTERETRELLAASGIALSAAGAALLHQRTEGWAAGLRLAAVSMAGHPDPERFVSEFSGSERAIADYLFTEMLERQPAEVQQVLLRTCLLDRFNGELADQLTGRPGSERILLELEDANAFVVSLDPDRTWFRYHYLFADLLRLELRRTWPDVPELHRRAAQWLSKHGQIVDAIRHTQAARDWPGAARLLADHSFTLMLDGQVPTMQALLRAFPPGESHPELAVVRATVDLLHGHLDEAAAHLGVAEAYALTADRRHRPKEAIGALKLTLARRGGRLADVFDQAGFLASPACGEPGEDFAPDSDLRAVALMNLGIAEAWSRRIQDAERHLREGAILARETGRPYLEVSCLAQLGFTSQRHSLAAARRHAQEAVALAERHGWGTEPVIAPALVSQAFAHTWKGEFDEAERWLQRAAGALRTDSGPDIALLAAVASGMLEAGRGRHRKALEKFTVAGRLRLRLQVPHPLASPVTAWLAATLARLGLPAEATAALAGLPDELAASGEVGNARALIHLARGNPADALGVLRNVLDRTAPVTTDSALAEAHLLAARAHRELGDQRAANRAAERALAVAEPDRLVLPFAVTGSLELLDALPRHETAHAALLADILDIVRGSSGTPGHDSAPLASTLSATELRVLRYLPTNLSRPEIASELCVSPNTLGTHMRNIYAKLQARDRSSAVQRARALRLLAPGRTR
jgi:LuxR family maltose regulon positive regulatory protein